MGKLILFMHVSLDGYASGPNGEMDWIVIDQEIFDFGAQRILSTNTALYGRKTFEMMEGYWPTAADKPNASKHDIEHSAWYKTAKKVVLSKTLDASDFENTTVIGADFVSAIKELKQNTVGDILLFGSPTTAHSLLAEDLIDESLVNVSPVVIGKGVPAFAGFTDKIKLELIATHVFESGVVCLSHRLV
jgi:dihydrofolate reductase